MSERYDVAVIGAAGPIAEALLELLAERRFPINELSVLGLDTDGETTVEFAGRPLLVEDARRFEFSQVRLAFLAGDEPELAAEAERAADAGAMVIDATGHPWRDSSIPLVVADLNPQALAACNERGIVAAPDRVLVALAPVVHALDGLIDLRELSITALLPASDFGRAALEDLARETTALLNARHYERQHYARQIAFNVLPQDGDLGPDGCSERERRIADEAPALFGKPLAVQATLLPAPVFYGLSLQVEVRGSAAVDIAAAAEALAGVAGLSVQTSGLAEDMPTAVTDASMSLDICISRLRRTAGGLSFWLTADNLRRCAALNAIASAEILVRDYL